MKKIIFVLILLIVTGCSAEYTVTIGKEDIPEQLSFQEEDSVLFSKLAYGDKTYIEALTYFQNKPLATSFPQLDLERENIEITYPVYEVKQLKKEKGLNLQYTHSWEQYPLSTLAKTCYADFTVQNNNNKTYFSTNKENSCFDLFPLLDHITIRVISKYEVIGSNADKVKQEENIYEWTISRDEKNNSPIYLTVDQTALFKPKMTLLRLLKEYPLLVIGTLALFIAAIVLGIKEVKKRKSDENS